MGNFKRKTMTELILKFFKFSYFLIFLLLSTASPAQNSSGLMEGDFRNPPDAAKPRTWWHWTGSNITKEGITKDLEWMNRAGIGGMQLADVASGSGQTVEKKVLFGSPEWLDAVKHAASEARRLDLEMTIFSSAGWSLTGGPWVKPEQAMKKLVWTENPISGPVRFKDTLELPPDCEGPFGNMSRSAQSTEPSYYSDCLVLAFPAPSAGADFADAVRKITSATGPLEAASLMDGNLNTSMRIRSSKSDKSSFLQFEFDTPFRAGAITLASRNGIPFCTLSASDDGIKYSRLAILPGAQLYRAGKVETVAFPETSAKYYRIDFTGAPWRPADVMAEVDPRPDSVYILNEVTLHSVGKVNRWEDKAGFFHLFDYDPVTASPASPASTASAIDPSSVIDLTSKMDENGVLTWDAPKGNWTVMRFGYSLTGSKNRPAVPSGLGYEVDKLSREHTLSYIQGYTDPIKNTLGPLYGTGLQYVLLDSWEAGMQNWTDGMIAEFRKRRGYDPKPFIPALSGYIIGNRDISDRFLWDFRRTLADMFAENHFSAVTDYLNKQGLKTYGEVSGVSLEILEDALLSKKYVDIPMGEFWFRSLHPDLMYYQDVRGAASASHIFGKKIVGAESFTGGGFESPWSLKKVGDYWFTQGVNRIIFHTSAHQPLDTKPGNTMVGTHINRNITWAETAKPFMTYLARNSYMLQQGNFVADIAYLLKEGAPSTMPIWGTGLIPVLPEGYDFDYINSDALISMADTDADGNIIIPGNSKFRVIVLPNTDQMTLPVLKKLHDLVRNGAVIIGPRPMRTPGLSGYTASEPVLKEMADDLWGDLDGISRTRRSFGKGQVFWGMPLSSALQYLGVAKDVEYSRPLDAGISWIHRKDGDTDIYFIVNMSGNEISTDMRFRVSGREAEIWDPVTGDISSASYTISSNKTTVPLKMDGHQSLFIVFRRQTEVASKTIPEKEQIMLSELNQVWDLKFQPGLGAPEDAVQVRQGSWTESQDNGIKYFSGTAVYTTTFDAPGKWFRENGRMLLDLGRVGDIAEVAVNGIPVAVLWSMPFRCDITGICRKGSNTIEVRVTNQWTNRLIGDRLAPAGQKVLNSSLFVRGGQLPESGLLGPVRLILEK